MLQKLMLAVTMTFALNLLLGIRPPANTETAFSAGVDLAQLLKVRTSHLASIAAFEKEKMIKQMAHSIESNFPYQKN